MKKIILLFLLCTSLFSFQKVAMADDLKYKKAYFAGGCFWCMEESFDKQETLRLSATPKS